MMYMWPPEDYSMDVGPFTEEEYQRMDELNEQFLVPDPEPFSYYGLDVNNNIINLGESIISPTKNDNSFMDDILRSMKSEKNDEELPGSFIWKEPYNQDSVLRDDKCTPISPSWPTLPQIKSEEKPIQAPHEFIQGPSSSQQVTTSTIKVEGLTAYIKVAGAPSAYKTNGREEQGWSLRKVKKEKEYMYLKTKEECQNISEWKKVKRAQNTKMFHDRRKLKDEIAEFLIARLLPYALPHLNQAEMDALSDYHSLSSRSQPVKVKKEGGLSQIHKKRKSNPAKPTCDGGGGSLSRATASRKIKKMKKVARRRRQVR